MPMKNSTRKGASSKAKPTRIRSWQDSDTVPDATAQRNEAFRRAILAIPPGKVSTYGGVAEAAGYPGYHRFVARLLHGEHWDKLPWHRVLGADGTIKTSGSSAKEQRARLKLEGVTFQSGRVDFDAFLFHPKNAEREIEELL